MRPETKSLLVLSPHLDDAVLSAAWTISAYPKSVVATVFAGVPAHAATRLSDWDRSCGFGSASEAIARRRAEDVNALARLGAIPQWLDFKDGQYEDVPNATELQNALIRLMSDHSDLALLIPLGLHHPDHERVADAAIAALKKSSDRADFWVYEDIPYRSIDGLVEQRIEAIGTRIASLERMDAIAGNLDFKRAAVEAYASQWPRLQQDAILDVKGVFGAEYLWRCRL